MVTTDSDRHYTPRDLAETLVATVETRDPGIVLDLAAGKGSLLHAAYQRWPDAHLIGVDTDEQALHNLTQELPKTKCIHHDAMQLSRLDSPVDVVVMNPPFSFRGGTYWLIRDEEEVYRCSPAMAFLYRAIEFLRDEGEAVALMPRNSLKSEKDANAWWHLRRKYDVRICGYYGRNTFDGCFPSVNVVHVRKRPPMADERYEPILLPSVGEAFLYRGTLPVSCSRGSGKADLLHTVHLARDKPTPLRCEPSPADLRGLVILMPRVGTYHPQHLVLKRLRKATRLSECVFAIWSEDEVYTRSLYKELQENFEHLEALFHGTCAKYITVKDLTNFLTALGWTPTVVRPNSCQALGSATFRGNTKV